MKDKAQSFSLCKSTGQFAQEIYRQFENIYEKNVDTPTLSQRIFSLWEEGEKKALEHFKHLIKICTNRGHIFQNKLRNTWTAILKTAVWGFEFICLVGRAKDKNKIKKHTSRKCIS